MMSFKVYLRKPPVTSSKAPSFLLTTHGEDSFVSFSSFDLNRAVSLLCNYKKNAMDAYESVVTGHSLSTSFGVLMRRSIALFMEGIIHTCTVGPKSKASSIIQCFSVATNQ